MKRKRAQDKSINLLITVSPAQFALLQKVVVEKEWIMSKVVQKAIDIAYGNINSIDAVNAVNAVDVSPKKLSVWRKKLALMQKSEKKQKLCSESVEESIKFMQDTNKQGEKILKKLEDQLLEIIMRPHGYSKQQEKLNGHAK